VLDPKDPLWHWVPRKDEFAKTVALVEKVSFACAPLWQCTDRAQAKAVFYKWYGWAVRSRLEPMKEVAQRRRSRISNILTYLEHRITNACSEGLNGAISTLIRRAYGYRSRRNLTTVIYFYLGGLSMDPTLSTHANPG
jgi:transposase